MRKKTLGVNFASQSVGLCRFSFALQSPLFARREAISGLVPAAPV
jgi:hypothetical protein